MDTPRNRTIVTEKNQTFSGYVPYSGTLVRLKAFNNKTQTWDSFFNWRASTTSSFNDCDGTPWYQWSWPANLPQTNRQNYYFHSSSTYNAIKLKATLPEQGDGDVATFETGADLCAQSKTCMAQVLNDCRSGESPNLTLFASCGQDGSACCVPNDICSASLCDWDFGCKTNLWPPHDDTHYTENMTVPGGVLDPDDWETSLQGIASDGQYWYVSHGTTNTAPRLWKVPLNVNWSGTFSGYPVIASNPGVSCPHWGDLDYSSANGNLYVPLEDCSDGHVRVWELSAATLQGGSVADINAYQSKAPAIAVHPKTQEFYMGPMGEADTPYLNVYKPRGSGAFQMVFDRRVYFYAADGVTRSSVYKIQGLAFSPSGKLYVASDVNSEHGLYACQVSPNKIVILFAMHIEVHHDDGQELEGVTVLDTDSRGLGMGQIHTFTYQNPQALGPWDGEAWFKHVRVNDSRY